MKKIAETLLFLLLNFFQHIKSYTTMDTDSSGNTSLADWEQKKHGDDNSWHWNFKSKTSKIIPTPNTMETSKLSFDQLSDPNHPIAVPYQMTTEQILTLLKH